MRKLCLVLALVGVLSGCGAQETFETIADEAVFVPDAPGAIHVSLPEETVLPVMQTDTGQLYICRDFEVSVQTLPGGDLDATVRTLSGFAADELNLLQTTGGGFTRYDFVWASAGETGPQIGRAAILSDGVYHYCVAAMVPEEKAEDYQQIFSGMFETVSVG